MKTKLIFLKDLFFSIALISMMYSCNTSGSQVAEEDLIGKFSVTYNHDLKAKDSDFIFPMETFATVTEFEFFKSGFLKCILEGDVFGMGVNYGYSIDSIKWELDNKTITFTIPNKNNEGAQPGTIKKMTIKKETSCITIKTDNVVYTLKKK